MDSLELNKIIGAALGTALGIQVVHLAASAVFAPNTPAKPGYDIKVNRQPTAQETGKPTDQSLTVLLAKANAERGKADSRVCGACHDFEKGGPNLVGPNLWNVVGRPRASVPGYGWSFFGSPLEPGINSEHDLSARARALPQGPVPHPT